MNKYIYVITPFVSWFIAQSTKYFVNLRHNGWQWSDLVASGGMPSAHSAMVSSLATVIGLEIGFGTPLFAFAATLGALVMYDAAGVRRAAGDQGEAIQELVAKTGVKLKHQPYIAKGHTPAQVAVGAVAGAIIGLVIHLLIGK